MSDEHDEKAKKLAITLVNRMKESVIKEGDPFVEIISAAVAAALREQAEACKSEVDKAYGELNRLRRATEEEAKSLHSRLAKALIDLEQQAEAHKAELCRLHPMRDEAEDSCLRCGCRWEASEDDKHECPPGFWNEYEKTIARLKAENERLGKLNHSLDDQWQARLAEISKLKAKP